MSLLSPAGSFRLYFESLGVVLWVLWAIAAESSQVRQSTCKIYREKSSRSTALPVPTSSSYQPVHLKLRVHIRPHLWIFGYSAGHSDKSRLCSSQMDAVQPKKVHPRPPKSEFTTAAFLGTVSLEHPPVSSVMRCNHSNMKAGWIPCAVASALLLGHAGTEAYMTGQYLQVIYRSM